MKLSLKVIDLFYKAAIGTKKARTLLTPVGMIFFVLFVTIFVIIAIQVDRLLKFPEILTSTLNLFLAVPLLCLGPFMIFWSIFHFLKVKGTPVPFNPPPKLVDKGPYDVTRNPMLTGVFFLLFGIGFLIRSVSLVCIFTPIFILIMAWELKKIEEPELARRFGETYTEYKNRTPMFFPGIRVLFRKNK